MQSGADINQQEIEEEFTKGLYDSRDRRFLHPKLMDLWPRLQEEFGLETGLQLEISCVWRSQKAQADLYALGRTRGAKGVFFTQCDGVVNISKHQVFPSKALDVFVCASKKAIWDERYYFLLEPLALKFGLIWGGSWKVRDLPHLQLPD